MSYLLYLFFRIHCCQNMHEFGKKQADEWESDCIQFTPPFAASITLILHYVYTVG